MGKLVERFPYLSTHSKGDLKPILPLCLFGKGPPTELSGLIDSGATVNVLPRCIGENLGLDWNVFRYVGTVGGAADSVESRIAKVRCQFGQFDPITLRFAWTADDRFPFVLGQADFFTVSTFVFSAAKKHSKLH